MAVNKTITALDLSNNYINEEGGKYLGEMLAVTSSLQHLNLERNSLGDEGSEGFAAGLAQNKTLLKLSLINNIIDVAGAKALAEAFKHHRSTPESKSNHVRSNLSFKTHLILLALEFVDLKENVFDVEGEIALADALMHRRRNSPPFLRPL